MIASGGGHALIVSENGDVYATGHNTYHQTGIDSFQNPLNGFEKVKLIENVVKVTAGHFHSIFITEDLQVYTAGDSPNGERGGSIFRAELPPLTKADGIPSIYDASAGFNFTLLLDEEGIVWGAGSNKYGQLSEIEEQGEYMKFTKIPNLPKIFSLCAGSRFSLFIDDLKQLWVLGANGNGQLGCGDNNSRRIPTQISYLPSIIEVSCGNDHTALLDEKYQLWTAGNNSYGQIGGANFDGSELFVKRENLPPLLQVCAASYTTYLLTDDQSILTLGGTNRRSNFFKSSKSPHHATLRFFEGPANVKEVKWRKMQVNCSNLSSIILCVDEEGFVWTVSHDAIINSSIKVRELEERRTIKSARK